MYTLHEFSVLVQSLFQINSLSQRMQLIILTKMNN